MKFRIRLLFLTISIASGLLGGFLLAQSLRTEYGYSRDSDGLLPDPELTPGQSRSVDMTTLCTPGSAADYRNVTKSVGRDVFASYGMSSRHQKQCAGPSGCELDHLVSIELGGSNDAKNLWPQPYSGTWNAHMKDKLENKLHRMVCSHEITLEAAQTAISKNWIEAYKTYVQ